MGNLSAMIDFLNKNAGALSVVFSFVVMIATVVYALLTWFLVRENKTLRKAETEPNISVYLEPEEQGDQSHGVSHPEQWPRCSI
jgi:heme/copper-type cytochrome/quinol oxidase subunit 2